MIVLKTYQKLNKSFKPVLVFRLGVDAGFFSEFNNMILAMAWCLTNEVQFRLYSRNAWFDAKGWAAYFEPFVKESRWRIHHQINNRMGAPENKFHRYFTRNLYRMLYPSHQLTYEAWRFFRNKKLEQQRFELPELNFQGDLQLLCRKLTEMVWKYNSELEKGINELIEEVGIERPYVGFHIRGGDKFKEDSIHPFGAYFMEMEKKTDVRQAFVLTDNYPSFKKAQEEFPEWELFTLCEEDEEGYYHQEFMKLPASTIRHKHVRLFASADILAGAQMFMGTFSSNPGMYLGMRMEPEKCFSVDGAFWGIW